MLETILVGGTSSQMLIVNICSIKSSWISSDDGILAIDSNGNRLIDNSSELIEGLNQGEGFAKPGSFDSNGDSLTDASDTDFAGLNSWQDVNGNHQTDAGELASLSPPQPSPVLRLVQG